MTPDDVLHIRGLKFSADQQEGNLVGEETIELNLDLNRKTGSGVVRTQAVLEVTWPERGLSGTFSGVFNGEIQDGSICGINEFHGSGGFEGMKMVLQTYCPNLPGDGEIPRYEGVVIEPPHK